MSPCQCRTARWHLFFYLHFKAQRNIKCQKQNFNLLFLLLSPHGSWFTSWLFTTPFLPLAASPTQAFSPLKGMWVEFVIIFLCAFFISSHVAKFFAFRVVKPTDRPIAIIFAIQVFTVVIQVFLASFIGVYHGYGFTSNFIPNYIMTYCKNFVMAMPAQLFVAGPLARLIFRSIFVRKNKA